MSGRPPAVIVAGGGPVGLSATIELARLGIPVLTCERRATTCTHPKATVLNTRTMELFRLWGVEEEVRDRGLPVEHSSLITWATQLSGHEIGGLQLVPDGEKLDEMLSQSPTLPAICPQDVVEPILRAHAEAQQLADVRFATEIVHAEQDGDGVEAVLRSADGSEERVRARYLVAADGSESSIRKRLGIQVAGPGALGHLVNIYFRAELATHIARFPSVLYWIVHPEIQGVVHALDGTDRWLFNAFLDPLDPRWRRPTEESCLALVRTALGVEDLDLEIQAMKPWTMEALVADRFREGRIVLAGDAAHLFPPTGGFGLNTGIQDAHNLAWKLAAVLQGWAGDELLETYEDERRPVVDLNVDQTVLNARKIMQMLFDGVDDPADLVRDSHRGELARTQLARLIPEQREHFDFQGEALGPVYRSSAVVPDGTDPPLVDNPITDYAPSAHPGARAPHLWIEHDGEEISSLDLFDRCFVLLAGPDGEPWRRAAVAVQRELGLPLAAHRAGAEFDLVDDEESFLELYGLEPDGAVLVRPDGHVCWRSRRGRPSPEAVLRDALTAVLGRACGAVNGHRRSHDRDTELTGSA